MQEVKSLFDLSSLQKNTVYCVTKNIDLKGKSIYIPTGCTLSFDGAKLSNGTLISVDTRIEADEVRIFERVKLEGTWKNSCVFSEWLDFNDAIGYDNISNFQNLTVLCTGDELTHLYTPSKCYYTSVVEGSSPIILPSNVYWHNKSTIKQLPTSLQKYSLVLIHLVSNVTIDGGLFVGDVRNHIGSEGEWGHGIKCAGATGVVLKNLTCMEFWGDGIDLIEARDENYRPTIICDGIDLYSVVLSNNRRQGMSIEAAKNVRVYDSEFCYTGSIKWTWPSSGVDIEPWNNEGVKIDSVLFMNCVFHHNRRYDFQCYANCQLGERSSIVENHINLISCSFETTCVNMSNNVRFYYCTVTDSITENKSTNVKYIRCRLPVRRFSRITR